MIDFVLHFDKHLAEFVVTYGVWVYGILFGIEPKLRMFEVPPRDVSRGEPASLARRVPSVGGFGNPLRVPEMKDGQ